MRAESVRVDLKQIHTPLWSLSQLVSEPLLDCSCLSRLFSFLTESAWRPHRPRPAAPESGSGKAAARAYVMADPLDCAASRLRQPRARHECCRTRLGLSGAARHATPGSGRGCPLHRRGSRVTPQGRPWICAAAADVPERRSTEC